MWSRWACERKKASTASKSAPVNLSTAIETSPRRTGPSCEAAAISNCGMAEEETWSALCGMALEEEDLREESGKSSRAVERVVKLSRLAPGWFLEAEAGRGGAVSMDGEALSADREVARLRVEFLYASRRFAEAEVECERLLVATLEAEKRRRGKESRSCSQGLYAVMDMFSRVKVRRMLEADCREEERKEWRRQALEMVGKAAGARQEELAVWMTKARVHEMGMGNEDAIGEIEALVKVADYCRELSWIWVRMHKRLTELGYPKLASIGLRRILPAIRRVLIVKPAFSTREYLELQSHIEKSLASEEMVDVGTLCDVQECLQEVQRMEASGCIPSFVVEYLRLMVDQSSEADSGDTHQEEDEFDVRGL